MRLSLSRLWQRARGRRPISRSTSARVRLRLEALEDRIVLSPITVTNTNASGAGSLAAAVSSAQSGDVINFDAGLTGQTIQINNTLSFAAGVTNVSITGPTSGLVAISGKNSQQVFSILANQNVTLSNLEIKDGAAATGAGILNAGNLILSNCLVDHNTATASLLGLLGLAGGGGGGIFNTGTLTANNSTFASNVVNNGVISLGTISGGGLENYGGTVRLTNCTIADNSITSLVNALTESGAGLENTNNGTMTLVNCTVAGNKITALASIAGSGGGIDNTSGSTLNLINTIVVDPNGAATGADISGSITNAVNSLFSTSTEGQIIGIKLDNLFDNDLLGKGLLGTLGLNDGGSTPTLPLLGTIANNPAIGGGINPAHTPIDLANLLSSLGVRLPSVDQNGLDRALNYVDIGSFQSPLPTVTSVIGNPVNGATQLIASIAGPDGPLDHLTTGVVKFFDNGQLLGTVNNLLNGTATLTTDLTAGTHLITAVFSGVDGPLNLGGSTSPPIAIVNPSPLNAAVQSANQLTFRLEGFVLSLQPFLSNPFVIQAVVSGLMDSLSASSDPNVGLLLFQEFQLFSSLATYIKNPDNYPPNAPQTDALANQIQNEARQIQANSALLSSYPTAVLAGTLELYLFAGTGPQALAVEHSLSQLAPGWF